MFKRLAISALFLLAMMAAAHASDPIQCSNTALATTATGETQLVPLALGKKVYICGYVIEGTGADTVTLMQGTGSACGSTSQAISPAYVLAAQTVVPDTGVFWHGMNTTASQELCVNATNANAQVIVYYQQQ